MAAKLAGVSMYTLMERAGAAVFSVVRQCYSTTARLLILAGRGNNGGDAYVVARLAQEQGMRVDLCEFSQSGQLSEDATRARERWLAVGGRATLWNDLKLSRIDVVIDGLLGTGITGDVKAPYFDIIQQINNSALPVIAIDVPSGLHADTGAICGVAMAAQHTVTFVGIKSGLVTGQGKQFTGELHFESLGIGDEFQRLADSKGRVFDFRQLRKLPKRATYSHKGTYGKLLCIGGNRGMPGSIRMTAEAAMRCGAGLVKVFCHQENQSMIANGRPELMLESAEEKLLETLHWCSAIVIGPGLGANDWAIRVLKVTLDHALEKHKPIVLDADALNVYSRNRKFILPKHLSIITPHPAEAARILQSSVAEVEKDRFGKVRELSNQFDCVALLKGPGSLVASQGNLWVCKNGNPGMATAGMGDVLSGVLGALLSQGMGLRLTAVYGMCLHSYAADLASAEYGERGLLASDLFPWLRKLVN